MHTFCRHFRVVMLAIVRQSLTTRARANNVVIVLSGNARNAILIGEFNLHYWRPNRGFRKREPSANSADADDTSTHG